MGTPSPQLRIPSDKLINRLSYSHFELIADLDDNLKVQSFNHENLGQLNTNVSWYRKNMMSKGDNPTVGILLCTQKDHPLVEYALAGMDNKIFVSKYQLELPKKEEIQRFLEMKMREVADGNSKGSHPDSFLNIP